jgi:hypothetical protein
MSDWVFFPVLGLLAALVIALGLVWPQGMGARSPEPFGHAPVQQSEAYQAARLREENAVRQRTGRPLLTAEEFRRMEGR